MKTLLFIGHPGHELLAHKFMTIYKPNVIFLTKGSGSNNQPRINQSISLVESLGLKAYFPFEPYTDTQIYNLILSNSVDSFLNIKSVMKEFIIKNKIEAIFGDALEGFNPSHDLCRYLINSIVMDLKNEVIIKNYDFIQDDVIKNMVSKKKDDDITITLNEKELQKKITACANYPELKIEVDRFSAKYGESFFSTEFFRKIDDPKKIISWNTKYPYYEQFGRKRVAEGTYKQVISFEEHMETLAKALQDK